MTVKTPKHWQSMELIQETTAYGNKVMIPRELMRGWESLRELNEIALKNGVDLSSGVAEYNHTAPLHHERRNALMVFYEKYQRQV